VSGLYDEEHERELERVIAAQDRADRDMERLERYYEKEIAALRDRLAAQQAVIKAAMRVVDCAEEVSTPDPDGPCVFEVGVLLMLELRSAIARYRAALAALDGEPK
jgi:hypothetical protein